MVRRKAILAKGAAIANENALKNSTKQWLVIACICGALAVLLGAFGAHSLKETLEARMLKAFETGVRYQFYHTFAIALAAAVLEKTNALAANIAATLFLVGIVAFSGSLYAMALLDKSFLGMITPFGGVAFVVGWIALAFGVLKTQSR